METGRREFVGPGRPPPGPERPPPGSERPPPGPERPSPGSERPPPGPERPPPGPERPPPSHGRQPQGSGRTQPVWVCMTDCSPQELETERKKVNPAKTEASPSQENFIERLPSEILMKILSYLDASSLLCMTHVSTFFHQIANDDVVWHKIYMSEFGSQAWKPKLANGAAPKVDVLKPRAQVKGHWKRVYLKTVAGQEIKNWRNEMKEKSPFTGLPKQTERALRNLNLSWELTVCEKHGMEHVLKQSQLFFLKSSMIIRWSGSYLPKYHFFRTLQLHAVRGEGKRSLKAWKPGWRSLISMVEVRAQPFRTIGRDTLIRMVYLSPCFIIGVWRGDNSVAFIMVSLHFHKIVERSLLGSPACPYSEPLDLLQVDTWDPKLGLQGYTLNLALHNTSREILSGCYSQLSCHRGQMRCGEVEFTVIDMTNLSQHRPLSGNITLPWKSEMLEGSVENCCIVTLTLLDEFQEPFWCVSSPVCISVPRRSSSFDHTGEHLMMVHSDLEGEVRMGLVWLQEHKQFFIVSLSVWIPISKVNRHFGTDY